MSCGSCTTHGSLVEMITKHANSRPNSVAAEWKDQSLTYGQLDFQSLKLATALHSRGIRRGSKVIVLNSRCLELLVFFLAVLKVGACYVPLDPTSLSENRIIYVVEIVKPALVLSTTLECDLSCDKLLWTIDSDDLDIDTALHMKLLSNSRFEIHRPEDLVYIIFTSGTTSAPKGVMIPHRALVNYVQCSDTTAPFNLGATPLDKVLLIFSPAFDACTGVIFSTLCNGGTLVIANNETLESCLLQCTILPCTPSILHSITIPSQYNHLRAIFLGGESPPADLISRWLAPGRKMYNCYGPSETTCASLIAEIHTDKEVTLGHAMPNSKVMLLDDTENPGDDGEICISGLGLATGYLNDEAQTHAKFIIYNGERFYKTGDFAKRSNGEIRFLGRADSMVKHRGFLISLESEVIPALCSLHGVETATAFRTNQRLVAFVTPASCQPSKIRSDMAKTFDTFLVPDHIFAIETLPLTSNGKLNVKFLRKSAERNFASTQRTKYSTSTNESILESAVLQALTLGVDTLDIEMSFWALGGSSLSAIQVLSNLRAFNLCVPLSLLLDPRRSLQSLLSSLTPLKIQESTTPSSVGTPSAPMTSLQEKLLGATSQNPLYNYLLVSIDFPRVMAGVSNELLREAWITLHRRHLILNASFDFTNHTFSYERKSTPSLDWQCIRTTESIYNLECKKQSKALSACLSAWELSTPKTIFRLVTSTGGQSKLLWLVHHSRLDGYSVKLLIDELVAILDEQPIPEVIPFSKASVLIRHLEDNAGEEAKAFWRRMADVSAESKSIEFLRSTISPSDFENDNEESLLFGISMSHLQAACRKMQLSTSTIFYCAWAILLGRYTSAKTVTFGVVFSGRNLALDGAERIVGPMLNVCPCALNVVKDQETLAWLHTVETRVNQMSDMQWSSERYISKGHDEDKRISYDTLLSIEYDVLDVKANCGVIPTPWKFGQTQISDIPWTLLIKTRGDECQATILYQSVPASKGMARRALQYFEHVVSLLLKVKKESTIAEVADEYLWGRYEIDQLIQRNWRPASLPINHHSISAAFQTIALEFPKQVALKAGSASMTYEELDTSANMVAWMLLPWMRTNSPVVIVGDGSINWVIGILAVLKTGSCYCVIDTNLPRARAQIMIELSKASIIVAPYYQHTSFIENLQGCKTFVIEEVLALQKGVPNLPTTQNSLDSPASLVFTSGTTGTPKGVMATHRGLLSYISYPPARLHTAIGRKVAQMFSVGFDACAAEIFGTLCYGGTLLLKDSEDIFGHLREADAAMLTPSLLSTFDPKDFSNLETIVLGGEVVPQSLADLWSAGRRLYNGYGPCECTVGSLFSVIVPNSTVTLGYPIPGMRVYILDDNQDLLPLGLAGEIFLSGNQVTNGYYSCEPKDQNRFIPDPWHEGHTMFRTGDRGMWTEKLEIEYLGRLDRQIKLRGFRIDLEEVESVIRQASPLIKLVGVIASRGNLIAYLSRQLLDKELGDIQSVLPHYSMPSKFIVLETFPLTANQKVDYKSLEMMASKNDPQNTSSPPETGLARILAKVWQEVLQREGSCVGEEDDFVNLGGHSLLQIRLAWRLRDQLQIKVPLGLIISNRTFSKQREALRRLMEGTEPVRHKAHTPFLAWKAQDTDTSATLRVSAIERDAIFLSTHHIVNSAFNVHCLFQITGPLSIDRLTASLNQVLLGNRILQTRYIWQGKDLVRLLDKSLSLLEIRGGSEPTVCELEKMINRRFDFSSDQLLKVLLYQRDSTNHCLLLITHHSIMDGSSLHAFFSLIQAHYEDADGSYEISAQSDFSKTRRLDYIDWLDWKHSLHSNQESYDFWSAYLANRPAPLFRPSSGLSNRSQYKRFELSARVTQSIQSIYDRYALQPQQAIAAFIALAFTNTYMTTDLVLAIPFSHRNTAGTEQILGNFLDRLPVRIEVDLSSSISTFSNVIKSSFEQAVSHALSYDKISETLNLDSNLDEIFEVMVSYHGRDEPQVELQLKDCKVKRERILRLHGAIFPVMFEYWHLEDRIECEVVFMAERVPKGEIELVVEGFLRVLDKLSDLVERQEEVLLGSRNTITEISVGEII